MGRIHIQKIENLNQIRRKPYPKTEGRTLISDQFRLRENAMCVFLNPDAAKELYEHINWGERTRTNIREQGGILAGYFYDASPEGESPKIYAEIEHIIPCRHPQISEDAYIYMSADNWKEMYGELDRMNEALDRKMVLVGWYHTHPNNIPTAFSGTDVETHSTKFTYPYSVGLVLNPQRKKWTVYYGPDCSEGYGIMLLSGQNRQEKVAAGAAEVLKQPEKITKDYRDDSWYWYQIQHSNSWGVPYSRYRVRDKSSDSFRKAICELAEWNRYNFCYLDQMGQHPEGILSIAVLKSDISDFSSMDLDSTLYLSSLKDLWEYAADGYERCIGFLAYRGHPDRIKDDGKLRRMLQMFKLKYLILCNMEDISDMGYIFEGFLA